MSYFWTCISSLPTCANVSFVFDVFLYIIHNIPCFPLTTFFVPSFYKWRRCPPSHFPPKSIPIWIIGKFSTRLEVELRGEFPVPDLGEVRCYQLCRWSVSFTWKYESRTALGSIGFNSYSVSRYALLASCHHARAIGLYYDDPSVYSPRIWKLYLQRAGAMVVIWFLFKVYMRALYFKGSCASSVM